MTPDWDSWDNSPGPYPTDQQVVFVDGRETVNWNLRTPTYHCPIHGDITSVVSFGTDEGTKHFCMECWVHELERTVGSLEEVR